MVLNKDDRLKQYTLGIRALQFPLVMERNNQRKVIERSNQQRGTSAAIGKR
ncbi:MAG: hypothetical protein IPM77_04715 [Crocinitomicaceae bacterium]|nr:hypothetical protein [Crocinitomicaceae bacterium]